ncbi:TMEM175 family protein [Agromyces mediolanus]|uniref:TMEM175 family protein n=1 Tax=Agromyces mediolanus TaxID=41986 RepID=UPI00203E6C17|nr:TMEM175 family protein [Agromyces mediolanus]MCM3657529.1 TMEM175 family protein [Agromyces mediolanus]
MTSHEPAVDDDGTGPTTTSAERLKAFTDAVVAIAMTLLILPLMESVTDAGAEGGGVAVWFGEHAEQLMSFALSFALIATFWLANHRVFARVERTSPTLLWLTIGWMFTIVWLPVPTAMLGAMETDDAQKLVYIGSLVLTSGMSLAIRWYLLRHPALHAIAEPRLRRGILADVITTGLFLVALALSILVPAIGYWALLLLVLVSPVHTVLWRSVGRGGRRSSR